jgi:hypothetical protein
LMGCGPCQFGLPESDIATLLVKRIAKFEKMQNAKMIEAKPTQANGGNADARLPPFIPDKRYRRF